MDLPPLRAIQCFESVARLNSFSKAAESLNVTQSAVSHQIRILEEYLEDVSKLDVFGDEENLKLYLPGQLNNLGKEQVRVELLK